MKLSFQSIVFVCFILLMSGFTVPVTAPVIECDAGFAHGDGGGRHFFTKVLPKESSVFKITIYHGRLVDGFEVFYYDSEGNSSSFMIGERTGHIDEYLPNKGVSIVGISGREGRVIDSIRFHFSDGSTSNTYGGSGGRKDYKIMLPPAYQNGKYNIRFHGKSGRVIDSIGIKYDC